MDCLINIQISGVYEMLDTKNDDTRFSVDEANHILDRTIGFINNCDSKASIILAIDSGFLAIVLMNVNQSNYPRIISLLLIAIGATFIIVSLIARISNRKFIMKRNEESSVLFFGDIERYPSVEAYRQTFIKTKTDQYLKDILSQIYINSCICSKKYRIYNLGTRISLVGMLLYILFSVLHNYLNAF